MAETTQISATQMIVTLEYNAMVSEIKKALKLIRGIASVRVTRADNSITPALRRSMKKAREEFAKGETISAILQKRCRNTSIAYDIYNRVL